MPHSSTRPRRLARAVLPVPCAHRPVLTTKAAPYQIVVSGRPMRLAPFRYQQPSAVRALWSPAIRSLRHASLSPCQVTNPPPAPVPGTRENRSISLQLQTSPPLPALRGGQILKHPHPSSSRLCRPHLSYDSPLPRSSRRPCLPASARPLPCARPATDPPVSNRVRSLPSPWLPALARTSSIFPPS